MEEKLIDLLFDIYNSGVDNTECDLTMKSDEIKKLFNCSCGENVADICGACVAISAHAYR